MGAFVLTSENYYSQEANKEYLSVSQYKQFVGTYGRRGCEFTALEELNGRWQQKKNSGMMIGSYVDSYVEGTLDKFKQENPEIFKKDGTLKADFTKAEQVIARIERDPFFMSTLAGEKQVIMTGELFGAKWKIKIYRSGELEVVSIKDRVARTELMIEHIDAMLEVYKKDCNRSPEGQRRYRVIYWMYLSEDESKTAEDIAEMENVVVRTVFRDIKTAYEELAVLFFGIDGVRFSEQ